MKITKDTGISIGVLAIILPLAFWFFTTKADKEDVKEVETKIEEVEEEAVERKIVDKEQSIYIEQMQRNQQQIQENQSELIKAIERLK